MEKTEKVKIGQMSSITPKVGQFEQAQQAVRMDLLEKRLQEIEKQIGIANKSEEGSVSKQFQ